MELVNLLKKPFGHDFPLRHGFARLQYASKFSFDLRDIHDLQFYLSRNAVRKLSGRARAQLPIR
jgi:hypothetical protein